MQRNLILYASQHVTGECLAALRQLVRKPIPWKYQVQRVHELKPWRTTQLKGSGCLEVSIVLIGKSDLRGLLELLGVLRHHGLVNGHLRGSQGWRLDELQVRITHKLLREPLEGLLELVVGPR
jgi:hypothetical protein